jgi:hypothetical protein
MGHHPDLEISWSEVKVSITNHAAGGLTAAVEEHNAPAYGFRRQRVQLTEAMHRDHLGGEAPGWRRDAAPETQDVEALRSGFHHLGVLHASNPSRHLHRKQADMLEPIFAHGALGPSDGALELVRAGGTIADAVA